jgi:hypothetical protein
MKIESTKTTHYELFSSFGEFIARASSNRDPRSSDKKWDDKNWAKTNTLSEGVKSASVGYAEIRPQVNAIMDIMEERLAEKFGNRFVTHYDVAGAFVDVGRFVTGEPECMVQWAEEPSASMGRVVRVCVAGTASASVTSEAIIKRGTAIVALLDTLHKLGVGVELWWDSTISGDKNDKKQTVYSTAVKLHDSSEPLDVDALMWAVAHPSMLRRLVFSVQEQSEYADEQGAREYGGYGHPTSVAMPYIMDFDVVVHHIVHGSHDEVVRDPLAWVISKVEGLGFTE